MKALLLAVFVAAFWGVTMAWNCANLPNGPHGTGCRSYTCCQNGYGVQVDCPYGCVFNHHTGKCDDPENVGPPCGVEEDCSALPDGSYPDMATDCQWYYTCINGIDMGKQQCGEGTVFSIYLQTCAWPEDVFPPCGVRPVPTSPPSVDSQDEHCDNYNCPTA